MRGRTSLLLIAASVLCVIVSADSSVLLGQAAKRPFSVIDDIQLWVPGGSTGADEELVFSPDERYFFVETERGCPNRNRVEDSLRFYRSKDVIAFLKGPRRSRVPSPVWMVNRSDREGTFMIRWRWLPDSSGVAFLEGRGDILSGNKRLVLADVRKKIIQPLTSASEAIDQFDVRDRQHYVYTAAKSTEGKTSYPSNAAAIVGTSHSLYQLLFPNDSLTITMEGQLSAHSLWAVINGKRFEVKHDGMAVFPDRRGLAPHGLALSHDGSSVIAALPVPEVPKSWETLYPPPFPSDPSRIRAGDGSTHEWVRINLRTGFIQSLTNAPKNPQGAWGWMLGGPAWSSDGQAVLLPGTFILSKDNIPSRPCVAVVDLASNSRSCVEMLKGRTENGTEEGFHHIQEVRFIAGDKRRVLVRFRHDRDFDSLGATEYERGADGTWHVGTRDVADSGAGGQGLSVKVQQGLNQPPVVVASYKQTSRMIWDPNPQLKNVELGQAGVYQWRDRNGREWRGGLFKPPDYQPGLRYPLVIQTHDFTESKFIPSGTYPTAFAARELAAAGILVLQVADESACPSDTSEEGPCKVSGYESGAEQLVSDGFVDSERVGIIGFSRTCYSVMEMLTTSRLRLKAASITDGVMADYLQYMLLLDWHGNSHAHLYDSLIGSPPFGDGLQQWLKRSPGFNLDKVNAPLLVVGEGPASLLFMWGAYSGLRYLKKPVDLMMLNTHEHVLTNPASRIASQGGSVDWFRFWLQDYEDPDPGKRTQYLRWRKLRRSQE